MALVVVLVVVVVADVDVVTCAQRAEQSRARGYLKKRSGRQTGPGRAHVIAVNLYKVTKNSYTAIPTHTHTHLLSLSLSLSHTHTYKQACRAKGLGLICLVTREGSRREREREEEKERWHTKHMLNFVLDVFFKSI